MACLSFYISGVGQWVESIGGQGSDYLRNVVTTPDGILIAGTTDSAEVKLGEVTIVNLQHQRADAASGSVAGRSGQNAHFAMMIHAEETISCIQTCTDETTTAVLKDGFCLIGSTCVANGTPACIGSARSATEARARACDHLRRLWPGAASPGGHAGCAHACGARLLCHARRAMLAVPVCCDPAGSAT